MMKILAIFFGLFLYLFTSLSFAEETVKANENAKVESTQIGSQYKESEPLIVEQTPQVGKHVMANMNASSMILSLLMVLALIFISAIVLKRFNLTQQNSSQLKVVASISLGAKERVVVVQIGEQQLVLGVCPQQISLLKNLETPIDIQAGKSLALSGNVLSFLQKNIKTKIDSKAETDRKTNTDSNIATSETTKKL